MNNSPPNIEMVDIQNQHDNRQLSLEMVGIKNIALPFLIPTKTKNLQNVKGVVSFLIDLDHHLRGTHMSRFVEILYSNHKLPPDFPKLVS